MTKPRNAAPINYTRREFGKFVAKGLGAAAVASVLPSRADPADPPFTVAVVPDPQYLAGDSVCGGSTAYNGLIKWAVDHRQHAVAGAPLNIKGFIQVGDCQNTSLVATQNSQASIMVNAWQQATRANMFVAFCCGNHDYEDGGRVIDRGKISHVWRTDKNGAWQPSALAGFYGAGMDLGAGDVAYWGSTFTDPDGLPDSSINNYIRLNIGSRKILIIALEFFPRNKVMNWAKSIHDAHPDHECWLTTHGYMDNRAARCSRSQGGGPDAYTLKDDGTSNCGEQMFSGNANGPAQPGIAGFMRARLVTCGHFTDGWTDGWIWRHNTARGASNQSIEEVFADAQGAHKQDKSLTGDLQNYCGSDSQNPDRSSSTAHLMLLRIWPTTMEAFMVSTNSGKWIGAKGVTGQVAPVQLWNIPFRLAV
jgi:hypothetical protein